MVVRPVPVLAPLSRRDLNGRPAYARKTVSRLPPNDGEVDENVKLGRLGSSRPIINRLRSCQAN